MKVRILPSANRDLLDGYRFYEERGAKLGAYFLDTLIADIDSLVLYAGIHPVFFSRYHRMLARRFPFAIYYRLEENNAIVYAVVDCRRDPAWIRERLAP